MKKVLISVLLSICLISTFTSSAYAYSNTVSAYLNLSNSAGTNGTVIASFTPASNDCCVTIKVIDLPSNMTSVNLSFNDNTTGENKNYWLQACEGDWVSYYFTKSDNLNHSYSVKASANGASGTARIEIKTSKAF